MYGFDTNDEPTAIGALLIYAVYRSRDRARFRVSPDLWGQIERFAKAAAKRSSSLWEFLDAFTPRLCCSAINPKWMAIGIKGDIPLIPVMRDGKLSYAIQIDVDETGRREFLTGLLERADHRAVLSRLYHETLRCVLHVRDRLEKEKAIVEQE